MLRNPIIDSAMVPFQEQLKSDMSNFRILDIGIILNIKDDVATVQSFNRKRGMAKVVSAEVLYPGNIKLGLTGNPCLLVVPASGVQSIREGKGIDNTNIFAESGVKCIPLFLGNIDSVGIGFREGAFTITTEDGYDCVFNKDSIDISTKVYSLFLNKVSSSVITPSSCTVYKKEGDIETIIKDNEGIMISRTVYTAETGETKCYYGATAEPEEEELDDLDSFNKWTWLKTFNKDGSFVISRLNIDDPENTLLEVNIDADVNIKASQYNSDGDILNEVTLNNEGNINIITGENISLDITQEGDISVSNSKCTIKIDKDGNITVENEGDTSITTSGNTEISTSGDTSITTSGNTEISSDGNIDVTATGSGKLTIGNSVDTIGGLFGALVDEVSGLATVGSPAAHTVNPANIAKLNTLKSKAGQVLG